MFFYKVSYSSDEKFTNLGVDRLLTFSYSLCDDLKIVSVEDPDSDDAS